MGHLAIPPSKFFHRARGPGICTHWLCFMEMLEECFLISVRITLTISMCVVLLVVILPRCRLLQYIVVAWAHIFTVVGACVKRNSYQFVSITYAKRSWDLFIDSASLLTATRIHFLKKKKLHSAILKKNNVLRLTIWFSSHLVAKLA